MNIYFVSGASGSGKTIILQDLREMLGQSIAIHDFDDVGVPKNADKKWRQKSTEKWIKKLIKKDKDSCLVGQIVLGEILACPSAKKLGRINLCFLEVEDFEHINRLKKHRSHDTNQDMLNWAAWLRMHHQTPQWAQAVIKEDSWDKLDFKVWDKLENWNSKANIKFLDTSKLAVEEVAANIANWIKYSPTRKQEEISVDLDISLTKFLIKNYSKTVTGVKFIGKGMFSSGYKFLDGDEEKIIRLNIDDKDFLKDQFAEKFSTSNLPIPKVLTIGKYDKNYFYAISKNCKGKVFNQLSSNEKKEMMQKIAETLLEIHNTNIDQLKGYGTVDVNFNGKFNSWGENVLNQENHKIPYNWDEIFKKTFFDPDLFDQYKNQIKELIQYLPKARYLVHGDFGFDNLIVNNGEVTGVIDWAEARLGDFLFDIAWLDFWSDDIRYSIELKNEYHKRQMDLTNYNGRLKCYILQIGLSSMAIAGHFNNRGEYIYATSKITTLLNNPPYQPSNEFSLGW